MLRKVIHQLSFVAAALVLTASYGIGSTASAASITNTGPGSTNIISSYGGSISNTGPYSKNTISNGKYWQQTHTGNVNVYDDDWCWANCNTWDWKHRCDQWELMSKHKSEWKTKCHSNNWPVSWHSCNVCSWSPCSSWDWKSHDNRDDHKKDDKKYSQKHDEKHDDDKDHKNYVSYSHNDDSDDHKKKNYGMDNNQTHLPNKSGNHKLSVKNDNKVDVDNNVDQHASTGNATVSYNTHGGSATTGDATNNAEVKTNVEITNASLPSWGDNWDAKTASIDTTGPWSHNKINMGGGSHNVSISNDNNVDVNNDVNQHASTGNATVSYNTHGGNATTGDATNNATVNTTVSIRN